MLVIRARLSSYQVVCRLAGYAQSSGQSSCIAESLEQPSRQVSALQHLHDEKIEVHFIVVKCQMIFYGIFGLGSISST